MSGTGDPEKVCFYHVGDDWISPSVYIGLGPNKTITLDKYLTGFGSVTIYYRTAGTKSACELAAWIPYSGSFASAGWAQVRLEA